MELGPAFVKVRAFLGVGRPRAGQAAATGPFACMRSTAVCVDTVGAFGGLCVNERLEGPVTAAAASPRNLAAYICCACRRSAKPCPLGRMSCHPSTSRSLNSCRTGGDRVGRAACSLCLFSPHHTTPLVDVDLLRTGLCVQRNSRAFVLADCKPFLPLLLQPTPFLQDPTLQQ